MTRPVNPETPRFGSRGRSHAGAEPLADALATLAEHHGVPGAQLTLIRNGSEVSTSFGHTTVGGSAVDLDTKFPIGSLTKPLTAIVALQAAQDEGLELDEPLPMNTPAALTLRQLLSHTAGLASGWDVDTGMGLAAWERRSRTDGIVVRRPGAAFSYSNLGYMLAGRFIEVSTGECWKDAVGRALVPAPALGIDLDLDENEVWARGHHMLEGPVPLQPESMAAAEHPAGAAGASARTLAGVAALFWGAPEHTLGTDITDAMLRETVTALGHSPAGLADGWTVGWAVYEDSRGRSYGHDGTSDGVSCHLRFDPDRACALAFTGNSSTAEHLWWDLQELPAIRELGLADLRSCDVRSPDAPSTDAPVPLGAYRNGTTEFVLERHGGGLVLRIDGALFADVVCYPNWEMKFYKKAGRGTLAGCWFPAFNGHPAGLQVCGRLADRVE